jgi:hypothetical protein
VGDEVHLAQHRLEIEIARFLSHALRLEKVAKKVVQIFVAKMLNDFLLLAHTLERLEAAVVLHLLDSLPHVVLWFKIISSAKILVQDLFFWQLFEVCHRLLLALVFLCWQIRDRLGIGLLLRRLLRLLFCLRVFCSAGRYRVVMAVYLPSNDKGLELRRCKRKGCGRLRLRSFRLQRTSTDILCARVAVLTCTPSSSSCLRLSLA